MAYSMTKIRYSNLGKYGGGTNEKRNCYTIPKKTLILLKWIMI